MSHKERGYHHGDLRDALVRATDQIISENGIEGFSLRDAARRAGVSPGAPAHHFGNACGLLTEVAILGYQALENYLNEALDPSSPPNAQMRALATAYIAFAQAHPGRFRLMFRKDLVDRTNERYRDCSWAALIKFAEVTARINETTVEAILVNRDHAPVLAGWSLAHGIAHLVLEDKFSGSLDENAEQDFERRLLPEILKAQWP